MKKIIFGLLLGLGIVQVTEMNAAQQPPSFIIQPADEKQESQVPQFSPPSAFPAPVPVPTYPPAPQFPPVPTYQPAPQFPPVPTYLPAPQTGFPPVPTYLPAPQTGFPPVPTYLPAAQATVAGLQVPTYQPAPAPQTGFHPVAPAAAPKLPAPVAPAAAPKLPAPVAPAAAPKPPAQVNPEHPVPADPKAEKTLIKQVIAAINPAEYWDGTWTGRAKAAGVVAAEATFVAATILSVYEIVVRATGHADRSLITKLVKQFFAKEHKKRLSSGTTSINSLATSAK